MDRGELLSLLDAECVTVTEEFEDDGPDGWAGTDEVFAR